MENPSRSRALHSRRCRQGPTIIAEETAKLLGGNYRRVFEASIVYDPPAGRLTEILLIPI
jgi:hypothetical protein